MRGKGGQPYDGNGLSCHEDSGRPVSAHIQLDLPSSQYLVARVFLESGRRRKKVEMLFAHLKRILGLARLRLRGPNGAKDEFLLAPTAQNLRKLAKLVAARPNVE
jgi:hypothetical protein